MHIQLKKYNILMLVVLSLIISSTALSQENESKSEQWRTPASSNMVYMQLEGGKVIIELAPFIAPKQVRRFVDRINEGFYDNTEFYRVIDGFVAQGGDVSETKESKYSSPLKAEFTRQINSDEDFLLVQKPELFAQQTGFLNGFAAGQDLESGEEWLLHCPGVVGFARGNESDWSTGDFYIIIGQAPRQLDRNMTILGRVVYGMPAVQNLKRAELGAANGIIEDETKRSPIVSIKMASDVPADERLNVQVQQQASDTFATRLNNGRTRSNEFFKYKGNGDIDVCYHNLPTRLAPAPTN